MEINLKSNTIPKPAKVYPAGKRDRKVINQTYNKLHVSGRFSWLKYLTEYSYLVFIIW